MIGKRLGQCEIVEEMGLGGMAVVYRARQPSLNRDVAIKVLPPHTYNEGEPWQLNEYSPPPGSEQPIKGFDRVWENNPQVRDRVGWALRGEIRLINGNYEDYQNGTALWLRHEGYLNAYFLLYKDGTWQQR